jgi:putative FmdB family regulatory protein
MPTYEYECQQCHERVEAVQRFADSALTVCPQCGGELRKVFSSVGIVFKGSGFYKNDSRKSSSVTKSTPSPSADAGASSSPAATTATAPSSSPSPSPSSPTKSTASAD